MSLLEVVGDVRAGGGGFGGWFGILAILNRFFSFFGLYLANLQTKMVYFCLSLIIKAYFKKMKKL